MMNRYSRTYAAGYRHGSEGRTPITAAALNNLDEATQAANDRYEVVADAAGLPEVPESGQLFYSEDLNEVAGYHLGTYYPVAPVGSVVQTVYVRSDTRTTYTAAANDGTAITQLNLTITPRYLNSWVLCRWMINAEVEYNTVYRVFRDGALPQVANLPAGWPQPAGYNTESGPVQWSGLATGHYDRDTNSTPSNYEIVWVDPQPGNQQHTYAPAIAASYSGFSTTFALNRTVNGSTGDNFESMISIGFAMEIVRAAVT